MMNITIASSSRQVNRIPNACPICHLKIHPAMLDGRLFGNSMEVVFQCVDCKSLFIAYYKSGVSNQAGPIYNFITCKPQTYNHRVFSTEINEVSPAFDPIYNEAAHAESLGMEHICGPGSEKLLNFL
jgi:hypothetical protein